MTMVPENGEVRLNPHTLIDAVHSLFVQSR